MSKPLSVRSPLKHPDPIWNSARNCYEVPAWELAYRGLSAKRKAIWDARNEYGLEPMPTPTPELARDYPNKKSGALDFIRRIRKGTNDAQMLYDMAASIATGQHPMMAQLAPVDYMANVRWALDYLANHAYPRIAPVDDKGEAVPEAGGSDGNTYTGRLLELLLSRLAAGRAEGQAGNGAVGLDAGANGAAHIRLAELGEAESTPAARPVDNVADSHGQRLGEDQNGSGVHS